MKSLTLTQLAELHDKICLITASLVEADGSSTCSDRVVSENKIENQQISESSENCLERDYETLNKRIAALQKQISEKECEAARKMYEMKNILRQEQMQLIKISEEMTQEKKRNLALQMTIDQDPCWISNCPAECRGDFDSFMK